MITKLNEFELLGSEVAAVDELVKAPGWRVILGMLENRIAMIEESIGREKDPYESLRLVRTWQVFRDFYAALRQGGQAFVEALERQQLMEGPEGAALRQMYSMRPKFGQN